MKIARFSKVHPVVSIGELFSSTGSSGPSGQVPVATGSNGSAVVWGSNVANIFSNGSNKLLGPDVNFAAGSNITLAVSSNTLTISSTGGSGSSLIVADEGTPLSTAATTLDFIGAGVTASGTGATKTITISSGSTAPTLVQSASDSDGSGTPAVVLSATPSQSNLMIWLGCNNGSGPTSLTQTNATWTMRSSVNVGGTGEIDIWTGVWDGSGTIGTTITAGGSTGLAQALVAEWSGITYSGLGANSFLHTGTVLDAFRTTSLLRDVPAGRIILFAVHTAATVATAPAILSCPWFGHPREAAQSVSMGISTGLPIQGFYEPGGSPTYTLADIVPT